MTDYRRKALRGERATKRSAALHNATVDASRRVVPQQPDSIASGAADLVRRDTNDVLVRNDTGGDLARFSVVALGDLVVRPVGAPPNNLTGGRDSLFPCFAGHVPAKTFSSFAVLQEPIASGAIGRAVTSGITPVRVAGRTSRNLADMAFGSTAGLTTEQEGGNEGHADVIYRAPNDSQLSTVRLDNAHVRRFHFGVLRFSSFIIGAPTVWTYDRYGDTLESLTEPPVSTTATAIIGEFSLRAGELVAIVENQPADFFGPVTAAVAIKFFQCPKSYDGLPPGLVALFVQTASASDVAAPTSRIPVDAVELVDHFEEGTVNASLFFEFDFASWHGVGAVRLRATMAVLIGSGWTFGHVTERHDSPEEAFLAACGGTATAGNVSHAQDSIALAPAVTPPGSLGFVLGEGHELYDASNFPISGAYVFTCDTVHPFGADDLMVFADRVSARAVVSFQWSDFPLSTANYFPMGYMFPGIEALLPSPPYANFWQFPNDDIVPLGGFIAAIAARGYFSGIGLPVIPNKLYPGMQAGRAMPAGGSTAAGTYDVLPYPTFVANATGGSSADPVALQVAPPLTVS